MKQKCSFILKASTALVLALLMLFGTVTTSLAAVVDNAATGADADVAKTGTTSFTVYWSPDATDISAGKTFKLNMKIGGSEWDSGNMTDTGKTINNKAVYSGTVSLTYDGFRVLQFQTLNNGAWEKQVEPVNVGDSGWISGNDLSNYNGKYYNGTNWVTPSYDVVKTPLTTPTFTIDNQSSSVTVQNGATSTVKITNWTALSSSVSGNWCTLALYKDGTKVGNNITAESTSFNLTEGGSYVVKCETTSLSEATYSTSTSTPITVSVQSVYFKTDKTGGTTTVGLGGNAMTYDSSLSTGGKAIYKLSKSLTTGNNYIVVYDSVDNANLSYNGGTLTETLLSSGGYTIYSGDQNVNNPLKINVTTAGTYNFYFDANSNKLYVEFPHTVTYKANGHGTAPSAQTVTYGSTTSAPTAPTATGWTFGGWYKEAACTNAWNFTTDKVTADTTLYAKWSQNAHSIAYSTGAGYSNPNGPASAGYGDTVNFTVTPASGYRITSVKYTPSGGSAKDCTAGSGNTYSFTMPDKDVSVTVTAVKTYTVTLSASGTGMGSTKQYFVGTTPGTYSDYSSAVTVDAGSTVYFKVSYATGYEYNSVTNATVYTANTVFKTGAINADTTVTITASEKAKKTITVTNTSSGGTGTINVSGNSVSGEATSFAAGTSTFQAHVDDVLTFSATPGSQSKLSDADIQINGTKTKTLTVTGAATVTATFVNDPSTILYIQKISTGTQKLYTWSMKSTAADADTVNKPQGNYGGATISGISGVVTLKINGEDYYKVTIANSAFGSTYFGAIVNNNGSNDDRTEFKGNLVGGTYKISGTSYNGMNIAAWSDSNYAVNLTETGGTLNTTHSAAATFQSNSTSSDTNPANYAGSTITVTAHPKTGYWAFVTATYGGSATTGLAETGSGLVSNIIKKIELAATGAGETAVTVTGNPIKTDGGTATFTMPAGATDIVVNYTAIPTYTMKLSAGSHGTIALKSGSTTLKTAAAGTTENVTVTAGTEYTVVVTPDSGYLVKTLSEAGTNVSAAAGKTSAYTHSWTAPDEQPGNTYLTGTFAKNDPEIGTLLYNGYDTSGSSLSAYADKAFKTSTYNGETFAYYKVSGRGTGDHLFTVTDTNVDTGTRYVYFETNGAQTDWKFTYGECPRAVFYGGNLQSNVYTDMTWVKNIDSDDNGRKLWRIQYNTNANGVYFDNAGGSSDNPYQQTNCRTTDTPSGTDVQDYSWGAWYQNGDYESGKYSIHGYSETDRNNLRVGDYASYPAGLYSTTRVYNGDDNGSGKAYQHSNDGFYGSDMPLYNHNTNNYNYEKTNSSSTSDYYILYFYPNTNYGTINNNSANNTNDFPIIVASTKLPNDEDDGKITVYAKYGTVDTGRNPTAEFGSTTVVTNADVEVASTNTTDGYVVAKATPGKSITLTTTVNAANASKYYVKGWDINGTTYGLNPEATGNSYTLTYNIPEDAETLEITPIYWMKDSSKMTRFYVRSFNEAPAAWGDALYCYFYNSSTADIGYPGQPCVHEGALYYTEIPTDSQGITLNNAVWDTIHGEMMMGLSGTTAKQNAHYQTYDYDNFQKIVKEKSDGLKSIYFTFEFRDKKDNLGSTSGSSSSIKLSDYDDTNGNGWEDFKDLKGNFINIFDEELGSGQGQTSLDTSKTLYVISNGYACNYEGEFATEWAVYVSTDGTNATYVTTIPSSALLINSAARLSESVYPNSNTAKYTPLLSSYTSAYNTLKNTYLHYKVKITYEKVLKYGDSVLHGNNIETNDIANRIDGKWDYTKNTDYVVADVKIQYRNTPDGAYTDDSFGGTGNYTGTTTQATAYFTNEEPVVSGATSIYQKTSCPTGTYYVSNDVYFTFLTTPKASAGYQFDGWYMKTDASDEAVLIDTSTSAKSLMDSNATFIARYTKVSSGSLTITHSSSGSGSANRIALKAEVIDPNDPANAIETYSGTDYVTIPTAYIKNTSSYQVKVTLYSVANPATSYIDMVTDPTAITSEKDGGSVNVFNSPTYTYDRGAASKYNQNVTTVIGAFNISALFSGTTQNTMLINYTTRIDKLPTYTINYRYHGRGQTGDDYMTFTRTISLTPDEAEGKNADGTTYSGNNGQALTATYITSSSDNLVNDITANAPNQNDLQTEVFNKEIEWEAPNSIGPNSTTVTAEENDPKYTLTYWYVDVNTGLKQFKTVEAEYNKLITLGEKIGETDTFATAETSGGEKFAYWALGNQYGDPLTSTREYKMRLVNNVTIYPVYGTRESRWTAAIDKITRTHQTSDTSDSIFTDFALRFTGFDDNGSFIHINPDYKDKYTVGVAVVYDTEGNNTTETTEQLPDDSEVFYDLSKTTKYKTAQEMIQLLVTGNKTTARLKEISDTTYVSKYDADNDLLTNFNRIDYAIKYNYNTYYKRSYDAYAYIVDKDTNTVLDVSPVKSGYLYDGKLPSGAGN